MQIFGLQHRRLAGTLRVDGYPRRDRVQPGKVGAITNAAVYLTFIK